MNPPNEYTLKLIDEACDLARANQLRAEKAEALLAEIRTIVGKIDPYMTSDFYAAVADIQALLAPGPTSPQTKLDDSVTIRARDMVDEDGKLIYLTERDDRGADK